MGSLARASLLPVSQLVISRILGASLRELRSLLAPGNVAAGVRMLRTIGDVVAKDEPLFEIHSSSAEQLDTAKTYAESRPEIIIFGF
jgi:thymidine phosphorylase